MHGNNGTPIIGWLELVVSSRWHGAIAVVHPVNLDGHPPCFGVMLDQRWLCGSDDTLMFFDSMLAATGFLNLLNVKLVAKGGQRDCEVSKQDAFQCFQFGARGISPCNKCRVEELARSQTSQDSLGWKSRW